MVLRAFFPSALRGLVFFPPFINQITQKVKRIHIGTHGAVIYKRMHQLFLDAGWDIVFSFKLGMTHHPSGVIHRE